MLNIRIQGLVSIGILLTSVRLVSAATLSPFAFVMIDSQTEGLYGTLPFNRTLIAKAVDRLAAAGAKGIVLKFFYDLPSTEEKDHLLELSICHARVALQASLNDDEGTTNSLDGRFTIDLLPELGISALFGGKKALIPLSRFARCAESVGFVDSTATEIPLIEVYQDKIVKSLHLIALEMASSQKAQIESNGKIIRLGEKRLDVMHRIDFPPANSFSYIPLHEVLSDSAKDWQAKVEHSVVILGYVGKNIHSIDTPVGRLGAHRFFISGLMSLAKSFERDGSSH